MHWLILTAIIVLSSSVTDSFFQGQSSKKPWYTTCTKQQRDTVSNQLVSIVKHLAVYEPKDYTQEMVETTENIGLTLAMRPETLLKVTGLTCSLLYAVTFYCVPHYLQVLLLFSLVCCRLLVWAAIST